MTPATKTGRRLVAQGFDIRPGEVVAIEAETMAFAAKYVRMVRDDLANRGQPQNPEWAERLLELMEWKS